MNYLDLSIDARAKALRTLRVSFAERRVERLEGAEISEDGGGRQRLNVGRRATPKHLAVYSEAEGTGAELYRHEVLSTEKGLGGRIDLVT